MGTSKQQGEGRRLRQSTPEERRRAVEAWQKSGLPQTLFARQWGVNPTTFSGWVASAGARAAGERRGRKPRLPEAVKREVVAVKRRFPTFGLRKVRDFVRRFSGLSVSTGSVKKVLAAEGIPPTPVVRRPRRRKHVGPPQEFERAHPNELWHCPAFRITPRRPSRRRLTRWRSSPTRSNQSASRNARRASSGRKRPGASPVVVVWASARSFNRRSA